MVGTEFFEIFQGQFVLVLIKHHLNLLPVLHSQVVTVHHLVRVIQSAILILNLILDNVLSDCIVTVTFKVEKVAENSHQFLCLLLLQFTVIDEISNLLDLLWQNRQEEVPEGVIVCHDIPEEHRLTLIQFFYKRWGFLDELEDCLVTFTLLRSTLLA